MSIKSLPEKLFLKSGFTAWIINAPSGYTDELANLAEDVAFSNGDSQPLDFVQLFVHSTTELTDLFPQARAALKQDGILWISYPKISSGVQTDITRDRGWEVVHAAGLRPVTQVSIDEIWSALRFRPIS